MKKAVIMCSCRYTSPEMSRIDFNELSEKLHREFPDETFLLHPSLCEETGANLEHDLSDKNVYYITPACSVAEQRERIHDVFKKAGVYLTRHNWKPLSLNGLNTEAAFQVIKEALLEQET